MWTTIGNIASIIQILSAVPLLWAAYLFFTRAYRYKRKINEIGSTITTKPMALVIALQPIDITGQVKPFLDQQGLKNIPIRTYHKPEGATSENIAQMLSEILKIKSEMTQDGVTEVHLFLMVPVAFAVAVGAILDNWVRVKVYHLNREKQQYEYWTYLHKGFIPGLEYSALKEASDL